MSYLQFVLTFNYNTMVQYYAYIGLFSLKLSRISVAASWFQPFGTYILDYLSPLMQIDEKAIYAFFLGVLQFLICLPLTILPYW